MRSRLRNNHGQGELVLLAEGLRVVPLIAECLRELRGETVQCVNFLWVYKFYEFDQVGKVGVIAQGECGVRLVTEAAVWIDGPTGQDGGSCAAEITEHGRTGDIRRTEQHLAARGIGFVLFVRGETLAEFLVDFGEFVDSAVEHDRQTGIAETAEKFLAFAE